MTLYYVIITILYYITLYLLTKGRLRGGRRTGHRSVRRGGRAGV